MRRRLQKYLPFVLIALMVQILAPVAASWAAAMVVSDPLGGAEICHSLPPSDTTQRDQDTDHRAHDGVCPICCVAKANSALDSPQAFVVALPHRAAARVVWRDRIFELARSPTRANAWARAPPLSM